MFDRAFSRMSAKMKCTPWTTHSIYFFFNNLSHLIGLSFIHDDLIKLQARNKYCYLLWIVNLIKALVCAEYSSARKDCSVFAAIVMSYRRLDDGSNVVPRSYILTLKFKFAATAYKDGSVPRCETWCCQLLPFASLDQTHKTSLNKWNEIFCRPIIYGFETIRVCSVYARTCVRCAKRFTSVTKILSFILGGIEFGRRKGLHSVAWMNGKLKAKRM